ncbi:SUKH-3 immunity protein of toxin-antitoxin system [Streptomyces sp. TLI_235]|nr:SUKH-3 domain-containing protein [Streptomyces sp. TLI_235]PBC69572.1 SUKH-3 immunity protein of toxin-antitoxin system [Streptomyces sp. TLI_235]
MTEEKDRLPPGLESALIGASQVEYRPVDLGDACARYREAGYEVTPWLRRFLENYCGLSVTWSFRGVLDVELVTDVREALDVHPANVRHYARRAGFQVVPVGLAFDTEESVLLAENGDILLGGDAGVQRVAHGFEEAMRSLIMDTWDKSYL